MAVILSSGDHDQSIRPGLASVWVEVEQSMNNRSVENPQAAFQRKGKLREPEIFTDFRAAR
jgi:hypothetical protein